MISNGTWQSLRDAFEDKKVGRITSIALVEYLTAIEERPWAEWNRGKPMTASQVARQLKKHKIQPKAVRFGGAVEKGYQREDFDQAWARYCPLSHPPRKCGYTVTTRVVIGEKRKFEQ